MKKKEVIQKKVQKPANGMLLLVSSVACVGLLFVLLRYVAGLYAEEAGKGLLIAPEATAVGTGDLGMAPEFSLDSLKGVRKSLSDYSGTPLMLLFWTTWNPDAFSMLRTMDVVSSQLDAREIHAVSINSQEDVSKVQGVVVRGAYDIEILADPTGEVTSLYGARMLPVLYFIDAQGKIREKVTGLISKEEVVDKATSFLKSL
jgi:peroxiredoxin